jgi:hypothetical protein
VATKNLILLHATMVKHKVPAFTAPTVLNNVMSTHLAWNAATGSGVIVTPAPASGSPNGPTPTASPRPKKCTARKCNITTELTHEHGTVANLSIAENANNIHHLQVLSHSTAQNHVVMKDLWIDYFAWVLGSEEKALATFAPGAAIIYCHNTVAISIPTSIKASGLYFFQHCAADTAVDSDWPVVMFTTI